MKREGDDNNTMTNTDTPKHTTGTGELESFDNGIGTTTNHILQKLALNSRTAIRDGVYTKEIEGVHGLDKSCIDLFDTITTNSHPTIITEIKFASPSLGRIRQEPLYMVHDNNNKNAGDDNNNNNNTANTSTTPTINDPADIAARMIAGGAKALSVLTQPHMFNGSPDYFVSVRRTTNVPMLMKDIIVDTVQLDAAQKIGADYILLIQSMFDKGYVGSCVDGSVDAATVDEYILHAHKRDLKVLLEVHTLQEFKAAADVGADLVGINNRNLDTLQIDLGTTRRILSATRDLDMPVLSESGIGTPDDIRYLKECGAGAFLVGSSIMKDDNDNDDDNNNDGRADSDNNHDIITERVRRLTQAY